MNKAEYNKAALQNACDNLRDAINRRSAIKRAQDTYYVTRRPAYVDGVILCDRKVK